MPVNLYIPVEVKSRELLAKVFLAIHAARRGANVILGRKSELNELIFRMPPGVYYGLGAFENFHRFYADLKRRGFAVVVNEEEGLVTYSDSMYVNMRVSKSTLEQVDELYSWGNENQRVLEAAFPEFEQKFHVTGNPRFDLLKEANYRVYADEMDEIRKTYGEFVLICTSFSSVNHFDRNLDYVKSLVEKKTLRSQESIDNFKRYQNVKADTLGAFLKAIPKLAEANPSVNIVVRPHPSENLTVYEELCSRHPNIKVDGRFSVQPWIICAQAVIHHYCTTAIEALAVGTPRFALRPVKDKLSEKEFPFACAVECASPDDLVENVSGYLKAGRARWRQPPLGQDYSWFVANIADQVASEAIADRVLALAERIGLSRPYPRVQTQVAQLAYEAKNMLRGLVRGRQKAGYLDHKFSHLSLGEVESPLRALGGEELECRKFSDFVNIRQPQ
jgi:surface carbohydrate biosynthesis protein